VIGCWWITRRKTTPGGILDRSTLTRARSPTASIPARRGAAIQRLHLRRPGPAAHDLGLARKDARGQPRPHVRIQRGPWVHLAEQSGATRAGSPTPGQVLRLDSPASRWCHRPGALLMNTHGRRLTHAAGFTPSCGTRPMRAWHRPRTSSSANSVRLTPAGITTTGAATMEHGITPSCRLGR